MKKTVAIDASINKPGPKQLALYDVKHNNVPFSSRVKILAGENHTTERVKAFTTIDSTFNLMKWIQSQERTVIY